jgi:hypothetical protein
MSRAFCVALLAAALQAALLVHAAPQSAAVISERPAGAQSCTVSTSEFPAALIKVRDLDLLMGKYFMYCHADLSVIDKAYETETRDAQWAGPLEEKIKEAAAQVNGLKISGACRRSLCRIDFEAADIEYCYSLVLKFSQRLRPLIKGTPYAVGGNYVPMLPRGYREYLYSEVLPPAFLASFRQTGLQVPN